MIESERKHWVGVIGMCWLVTLGHSMSAYAEPVKIEPAKIEPVKILFDTDMASDCDDVGALAVLHALANQGEAEILAVVTNRKCPAGASAATCDVINTFYGRPNLPIGSDKDGAKFRWDRASSFTGLLRDEFPHDTGTDDEIDDALNVYRRTLAAQPDNSVVICSVGALSNLEDLLNSGADQSSPLSGIELIQAKVKLTVIMGGHFPRSAKPETNLRLDPPAAVAVVNGWPGEIIWQGFEIGDHLHCGATLKGARENNPVRRAFELRPFRNGKAIDFGKPAHDQATVLIAVRGTGFGAGVGAGVRVNSNHWNLSDGGQVVIDSDGHSHWRPDGRKQHRFVSFRARPELIAAEIERLMTTIQ